MNHLSKQNSHPSRYAPQFFKLYVTDGDLSGYVTTHSAMGVFDTPTGVKLGMHIHVASKGDYYDIVDNLPHPN